MSSPRFRRSPRSHFRAAALTLAASLVIALAGVSACRQAMAPDTAVDTAAHAGRGSSRDCVRRCAREFHALTRDEIHRHRRADRACGRDLECRRAERLRHQRRNAEIEDALRRCRRSCYGEGGVVGGR